MKKRVADVTPEELDRLAAEAWFEAGQSALKSGVPVVGRDRAKIVKRYPDGRTEILGEAAPLVDVKPPDATDRGPSSPGHWKQTRDVA